jgi:hypothetical protein
MDYYAPMGAETGETIAGNVLRSAEAIRGGVDAFAGLGMDELILDPTVSDPAQVDLVSVQIQ